MNDFAWQQDAPAFGSNEGIDIWGIVVRRKWIIIASTILGIILGVLKYSRAEPVYRSGAQVLIERNRPPSLPFGVEQGSNWRSFVADAYKHPVMMKSPLIVSDAYAKQNLKNLSSLSKLENPLGGIIGGLNVVPVTEGMGIYNVSYTGPNPQDAGEIVNGVLAQYNAFLESTHRDVGRETRNLIVRAKSELLEQLSSKEQAYNQFREEAPLIYKDGAGQNLHQERQLIIETKRSNLLLEINDLRAELQAIKEHIDRGDSLDSILTAAGIVDLQALTPRQPKINQRAMAQTRQVAARRPSVDKSAFLPLLLEEEDLLTRYGKDHPQVKAIRRRIESSKEFYLENFGLDLDQPTLPEEEDKEEPFLDLVEDEVPLEVQVKNRVINYVQSLRHQLEQLEASSSQLSRMFDDEQKSAKELTKLQIRDESYRNDIARTQQVYDQVLDKLRDIEVVGDYDGYKFEILAAAGPGRQIGPKASRILPLSAILGGLAGSLLAYLVDLRDKSFRDPVEISQEFGVPVVGHLPIIDVTKANPDVHVNPVLCTLHHPKSQESEAIRTVRTALFFSSREKGSQIIQVTSPRPGEGKSTISANLAVTIANSGKSCLLLDADFRRPRQHHLFKLNADVGLASVANGDVEMQSAFQFLTGVENLTLMPCGPRPENPSELLSSQRFELLLKSFREKFDFVLVDTPPLLAVSDAAAVAAQVDGVLLAMRIHNQSRPVAKRAMELLRETQANVLGVVVNGVGGSNTKGYYSQGAGQYAYNAQKYGYNYDYSYGAKAP